MNPYGRSEPDLTPLDQRQDIVQVRNENQVKSEGKASPTDTKKSFMTISDPGITSPLIAPKDFSVRPAFPALRPRKLADLEHMVDEYYLFHHGCWFTWGNLTYDPLLEFFVRDGESNRSVMLVPLKDRFLYGVARKAEELPSEMALFAIPRDRMRDLLFWMDGVVIADLGVLRWQAIRQHIPLSKKDHAGFDDKKNFKYLSFFGFQAPDHGYKWFYHRDGFGCGRYSVQSKPDSVQSKPATVVNPEARIILP
jgi:hypothetical protein